MARWKQRVSGKFKLKILYDITYTWNLKNNTNECLCKTGAYSQI